MSSQKFMNQIRNLILTGFISVDEEIVGVTSNGEEVIHRVYKLTLKGEDVAKEYFEKIPEKTREALRDLKRFNEMPLKRLNDYCAVKYGKPWKTMPLYIVEDDVKEEET